MPLDPDILKSCMPIETRHALTRRDTILYSLGIGVGIGEPGGAEALRFAYEPELAAFPTMATILAYPGFWQREPRFGLDWRRILHGEQSVRIHQPLPVEGVLVGRTEIDGIFDKGADKGALIYSRREIRDEATGDLVATIIQGSFLRGDGGFGGSAEGAPRPHSVPERAPDVTIDLRTRPEQALIYRLSGDYNPLHVDPDVARAAGFTRPILHGLCTYGVAGRAVLAGLCDGEPERLTRIDCRFTAPLYPGETIRTEIWREGEGRAAFRSSVAERGVVVLNNGLAEYR
ncbi:MaoC/PaaZ C-terminal domain-containing protein [Enterovirga aerilata]|uniref:3-alpha,7-alpha, 12-alpha-trihydroxy-5-beta-cholest-24-enoyl-CoA hydratase n=1 Tax=Enterovirga aerilata TaxID=2730920 RepID=A0A849I5D1_9HYPH|nr:MaoC/PaaZ C-terminal domain-containing protein [Enterovirga sp. DB1703]NNM71609.1 3-alpha,7-alpha,12-alpha-trihydroxy-5-beta-cholest-24-enoyl-CoA hydratase [Enterovirga sp. DB1703]